MPAVAACPAGTAALRERELTTALADSPGGRGQHLHPRHYESAFEDFLRHRRVPFIRVDQARQTIFAGARLKSFDFVIYPPAGPNLLVDVKGRRFPYQLDGSSRRRYWENWVTQDDLEALNIWEQTFGEGFRGMLVFAYWLAGTEGRHPGRTVHTYRDQCYTFLSVAACDYQANARPRSARWRTVSLPAAAFRSLARPIEECWQTSTTDKAD
jgi:hypothetical protein